MISISFIFCQSLDPVPSFYVIVLESLDGHGSNLVVNVTVHRNQETISVFLEDELPSKSLWNASVLANGCETNTHTTVTELSKLYYRRLKYNTRSRYFFAHFGVSVHVQ